MAATRNVDRTDYKTLYCELLKENGANQAKIQYLTMQASNSALANVHLLDIFERMREENNLLNTLVQTIISHPVVREIADENLKGAIVELERLNEEDILDKEETAFIEELGNLYNSGTEAENDANPIVVELLPSQFNWGEVTAPAAPSAPAPAAPAVAAPQKGKILKKNRPYLFQGTAKAIISAELQRCEVQTACKFGVNCKNEMCKFYHFCDKITPIGEERVRVDCEIPAHACKYVHVTCGCKSSSCKAVHLGKIHHSIAHLYQ